MAAREDDIWFHPVSTQNNAIRHESAGVSASAINGVVPLGDQFGTDAVKTVPDVLYNAFFAQPEITQADFALANNDPTVVPRMQTYAVLDAAKVTNMCELLEASELECRCLFKGTSYDTLSHVAPWIVQLKEDNEFTRALFTKSDAPWHLWEVDAGIYIRSRLNLDQLWKHFRKFTKAQDESGKWFYFRFWEPVCASYLLYYGDPVTRSRFLEFGSIIVRKPGGDDMIVFPQEKLETPVKKPFRLCRADLDALRFASTDRFIRSTHQWLMESYAAAFVKKDIESLAWVADLVQRAYEVLGLTSERAVAEYVAASWLSGRPAEEVYPYEKATLQNRVVSMHKEAYRRWYEHSGNQLEGEK